MDGNPCVDLMFGRKGLLCSVRVRVDIPQILVIFREQGG